MSQNSRYDPEQHDSLLGALDTERSLRSTFLKTGTASFALAYVSYRTGMNPELLGMSLSDVFCLVGGVSLLEVLSAQRKSMRYKRQSVHYARDHDVTVLPMRPL